MHTQSPLQGGMKHSFLFRSSVMSLIMMLTLPTAAAAEPWTENGNAIYTTNTNANVGIGTTDPQANLSVQGKRAVIGSNAISGSYGSSDGVLEINGKEGSSYINFISQYGGMVFGSSNFENGQNGLFSWKIPFVILQDGTEAFRIEPTSGNIGIGTVAPQEKLHVTGNIKASGVGSFAGDSFTIGSRVAVTDANVSGSGRIRTDKFDIDNFIYDSDDDTVNVDDAFRSTGNLGVRGMDPNGGYPSGWGGGIHAWDIYSEASIGAGSGGTVNAFMNGAGNAHFLGKVGIGTTTPTQKLSVVGDIVLGNVAGTDGAHNDLEFAPDGGGTGAQLDYWQGGLHIANQNATATHLSIKDDGKVGIGIITPTSALDVQGTITVHNTLRGSTTSSLNLLSESGQPLIFKTGGDNERMRITGEGNVRVDSDETLGRVTVKHSDNWGIYAVSSVAADNKGGIYGEASSGSKNTIGIWGATKSPGSSSGSALGVRGDALNENVVGGASFGVLAYSHVTKGDSGASRPAAAYAGAYGPYAKPGGISGAPQVFSSSVIVDGIQGETFASAYGSAGVYGMARATGVRVFGVEGHTKSTADGASGVKGHAEASTGKTYGVWGATSSTSGGAYGVYSSGPSGSSGLRTSVVYTAQQGPTEVYGEDATQPYITHYGEAVLVNGKASVTLDPLFAETVQIDAQNPMQVFVQPYGATNQLVVDRKGGAFEVVEQNNGKSNAKFGYRVVAKRKYYAERNLAPTGAEVDQFMRPDLTKDQIRELNKQWKRYIPESEREMTTIGDRDHSAESTPNDIPVNQ